MINRVGRYTISFEERPRIKGFGSAAGKKESQGPLKNNFDKLYYDSYIGQNTFEKAESMLQQEALLNALNRAECRAEDVDFIFAGDLLNQCISSSFGVRDFNIPYLGQYGACSTMAQGLIMAAVMVESGAANQAACVTSSHFCTAERQYRYPLEYGGQRTPTAQWTVTGSGSCVLGKGGKNPCISAATVGRIADLGVSDLNNMGGAMAPAASNTLTDFFNDTDTRPRDYDAIFTGDLGYVGSQCLYELMSKEGIDIRRKHSDCGLMIFDRDKQDVHSGGSGCGCAASVLCSTILPEMLSGKYKNILFIATGALMSPTSAQQGETIPAVAHLVNIKI
ncbi:MAG: stage V sporulation protein AD [Ruminococcus sp.]|nr:stage V sporulation protein AD [Ruminococcus sp.]